MWKSLFGRRRGTEDSPFAVFLAPNAAAISASGTSLRSASISSARRCSRSAPASACTRPFFLERGCEMTVTDGRAENVAEIAHRLPQARTPVVDIEVDRSLAELGRFDVVYCYGLLYHLGNPERALARLAEICDGMLLLETEVSPGNHDELLDVRDPDCFNQAVSGIGFRPTRLWVLNRLRMLFGHAYIPRSQPDHVDFPTDWKHPPIQLMYRSIFVGSRPRAADAPRHGPDSAGAPTRPGTFAAPHLTWCVSSAAVPPCSRLYLSSAARPPAA